MSPEQVEKLLRELGRARPADRLFGESERARLRDQLVAPATGHGGPVVSTGMSGKYRTNLLVAAFAAFAIAGVFGPRWAPYPSATHAIDLRADWAGERFGLFRTERAAAPRADTVWVGVRVDRDAFVSILAVKSDGSSEFLPLDRAEAYSVKMGPGTTSFGGYARTIVDATGTGTTLHTLLVIASPRPLPAGTANDLTGTPDIERFSEKLEHKYHCVVRVLMLPG